MFKTNKEHRIRQLQYYHKNREYFLVQMRQYYYRIKENKKLNNNLVTIDYTTIRIYWN